jgi:hypothetical protein
MYDGMLSYCNEAISALTLVCVSLLAVKVDNEEITRDVLAFISWTDILR